MIFGAFSRVTVSTSASPPSVRPPSRAPGTVPTVARLATLSVTLTLALGLAFGCTDPGEEGGGLQLADATMSYDATLDTGANSQDPDASDAADVTPIKGCSHDNHCKAFGQVCDALRNICVNCLTDQNCPQAEFCIENQCLPDLCTAGETRCWGKPDPTTHVALCKVNGGGWVATPCQTGAYCDDGKCIPLPCKPGALSCGPGTGGPGAAGGGGGVVLQCAPNGIQQLVKQDCESTGLVCKGGKCVDTSCSPGDVQCASDAVSLVCKQTGGKWRFEPVACGDGDLCTWDRCIVGKGCENPGKPNGIACDKQKWCYEGQCTDVRNNLIVMFDTSGSMRFKVPGKICYEETWPQCLDPHKSCSRMGVSKSVFKKAFVHVDSSKTRLAMFRFPQLWLSPERTTSPKPPHWKPVVACGNGNYMGYFDMTGHGVAETVTEGSDWYWSHLDEVLCAPFPETDTEQTKPKILSWMDGKETFGSDPELRAIGGTPIGRTLFYLGEYLRNRVVIDGKVCAVSADCKNPNYQCVSGKCSDPMRSCRQTTVVVFTDGGEENYANKLFSPWVQAKRLAYGLSCDADIDCVGGSRCLCAPGQAGCDASDRECLPEDLQTGYYCRSSMQSCLPEAPLGAPGYCPKAGGVQDCVKDPVVGVAAEAKAMANNVLRSPDGVPFGVKIHVVDISGNKDALERSGNLARAGGGLLLASDDADEDGFLLNLRRAFDVESKPACGITSVACAVAGKSAAPCDDGNPCTNDACNKSTGTCVFVPNTVACEDGDLCTLSERCLGGTCQGGIPQVTTLAGNGLSKIADGNALNVGMAGPRGVALDKSARIYVSDGHRIARVDPKTAILQTWLGNEDAGLADGSGKVARFLTPGGLDFAPDGSLIIADTGNHRIRAAAADGAVTTLAGGASGFVDGPGVSARFQSPADVSVDDQGRIWVADTLNHRVRRIALDGTVSTVLGNGVVTTVDGPIATATTAYPQRVDVAPDGTLMLAERYVVRRLALGVVTTLAGGAPGYVNDIGAKAQFDTIGGIVADAAGGVWVADRENNRLRYVTKHGAVTTQAGGGKPAFKDGFGSATRLWHPEGLVAEVGGALVLADFDNRRLRRIAIPFVACADGGPCNAGACDVKTGKCVAKPLKDGAPCATDACLEGETCQQLSCTGGTKKTCDDGDLCTADSCKASTGTCSFVAVAAPCDDGSACTKNDACKGGWCQGTPLNCDDDEPATLDVCEAGKCLHKTGPCKTDTDCFDGELVCTLDRCVGGTCQYQPTNAAGCCESAPFKHDFNDGKLGGMKLVNDQTAGGWGVWNDLKKQTPPVFALYYGDPKTQGYALAGANSGQALVPKLTLPAGRGVTLRLRVWLDVERAVLFDELRVVAKVLGQDIVLWQKGPTSVQKAWLQLELDLSPFSGKQVEIRLAFDTIDHKYNDGLGVLIDDVRVDVACN